MSICSSCGRMPSSSPASLAMPWGPIRRSRARGRAHEWWVAANGRATGHAICRSDPICCSQVRSSPRRPRIWQITTRAFPWNQLANYRSGHALVAQVSEMADPFAYLLRRQGAGKEAIACTARLIPIPTIRACSSRSKAGSGDKCRLDNLSARLSYSSGFRMSIPRFKVRGDVVGRLAGRIAGRGG